MAELDQSFIKYVELRLLRCTISGKLPLPPPSLFPSSNNPLAAVVDDLVDTIERGEYEAALSSGAARLVFAFADSYEFEDFPSSAARFYSEVERSMDSFLCDGIAEEAWLRVLEPRDDVNTVYRVSVVLCLGVAALLAFIQQNVTGPSRKFSRFPLMFGQLGKDDAAEIGGEWDSWARAQITSVGCDLFGKISLLQYFEYAKMILLKIQDFCRTDIFSYSNAPKTTSWWLCRLLLLQQRILDDLSSSLYNLLQVFKNETILNFGEKNSVKQYWGTLLHDNEALTVASMLQLEAGIMEYQYGRIDSSRLHLRVAAEASGTDILVTGVLGYRTVHQVDAKPQLVLVTKTGQQVNGIRRPKAPPEVQNADLGILDSKREFGELDMDAIQRVNDVKRPARLSQSQSDELLSQNKMRFQFDGDYECDILMAPRFVQDAESATDKGEFAIVGKDVVLTAIQQAIILAQCLHLQRSKRDDELSGWEMAPYIEAIDLQCQSNYIIRCSTDILRIRWESTRSRTKQRALLMMDKLVEAVYKSFPTANQRTQLCFAVYSPTIPAMRKEYGELCLGCGMVGEALKIFDDLELWDNLIYCYRLLDKKAAAVDLINARLSDTPDDPKLWCSLGDVTNKDDYYEKALEVSNNKSARAMRSLARSAYNRGDYGASKSLWESAMAVNSLYPDGWFALGAAALKARDIDRAVDGFTRAVQLDPENGEAWNNIACLHMINKKSKPAFIAFKEALKFRRNSWQLWENYSHVALDVGNFHQALEATKMVLDLSSNKRVDIELLNKVLTKVEENTLRFSDDAAKPQHIDESQNDSYSDSCKESENPEPLLEEREQGLLVPIIGSILQQVIKSGSDTGEIWGLYARWHKLKGNLSICSEALLKQIRSYQGTDMWNNIERFKKFAKASLLLCSVYMELASFNGSRRELFAAEMHLKNSLKQAVNFSETQEYRDLQACLDEVKKRLDAISNVSQL